MADLTITPANVAIEQRNSNVEYRQFGEAVAAGDVVYKKISDSKLWKADADASSETANVYGVALEAVSADGFGPVVTGGKVDVGATLTIGQPYVASANAGKIAPASDLASGHYITHLGYAVAADSLSVNIKAEGVAI